MLLDRMRDVAHVVAGLRLLDVEHQAFIGDFDEALRLYAHIADQIPAAGVAVPAVDDTGDVDIADVDLAHRLVVGAAVADDMVAAGAATVRAAAIARRRGVAAALRHPSTARGTGGRWRRE